MVSEAVGLTHGQADVESVIDAQGREILGD